MKALAYFVFVSTPHWHVHKNSLLLLVIGLKVSLQFFKE